MTILAIETSTHQGSVAVLHEGRIVFSESCGAGRSHSSLLFAVLERALQAVPEPARIDQIAVGLGPGSYAGVRIAISAATGLALSTGAELVGLPSIAALGEGEYVALGDARRETYYFARVRDGECVEGPVLLSAEELAQKLAGCSVPVLASEEIAAVILLSVRGAARQAGSRSSIHHGARRFGADLSARGAHHRGEEKGVVSRKAAKARRKEESSVLCDFAALREFLRLNFPFFFALHSCYGLRFSENPSPAFFRCARLPQSSASSRVGADHGSPP